MKMYEVIIRLEEDNTKLFMILDFDKWGLEYTSQVPYPIIGMINGKIAFYDTCKTVELNHAILNCDFVEICGQNKYIKEGA